MSDIDTAAADSLKVLDPERPIREADIETRWSPEGSVAKDPTRTYRQCVHDGSNYRNLRLARDSWLTEEHPISFMSRSISARMRLSAFSTPGRPAAANGNR